ncbi:MAG: uncharacterized protein KVP18_003353 [Porospora cf. gigantea A]|uniref:uncharacterized protein n=1 Tax=Porospora cf. gigantea A TaxID=2853593 RepID=UPI00355AAD97|nr:MAG: hypothetical protein KVP18_003353 [Porospora cf. gigantea A]
MKELLSQTAAGWTTLALRGIFSVAEETSMVPMCVLIVTHRQLAVLARRVVLYITADDEEASSSCLLLRDGQLETCSTFEVQIGDVVVLKPLDNVDVDGFLTASAMLTSDGRVRHAELPPHTACTMKMSPVSGDATVSFTLADLPLRVNAGATYLSGPYLLITVTQAAALSHEAFEKKKVDEAISAIDDLWVSRVSLVGMTSLVAAVTVGGVGLLTGSVHLCWPLVSICLLHDLSGSLWMISLVLHRLRRQMNQSKIRAVGNGVLTEIVSVSAIFTTHRSLLDSTAPGKVVVDEKHISDDGTLCESCPSRSMLRGGDFLWGVVGLVEKSALDSLVDTHPDFSTSVACCIIDAAGDRMGRVADNFSVQDVQMVNGFVEAKLRCRIQGNDHSVSVGSPRRCEPGFAPLDAWVSDKCARGVLPILVALDNHYRLLLGISPAQEDEDAASHLGKIQKAGFAVMMSSSIPKELLLTVSSRKSFNQWFSNMGLANTADRSGDDRRLESALANHWEGAGLTRRDCNVSRPLFIQRLWNGSPLLSKPSSARVYLPSAGNPAAHVHAFLNMCHKAHAQALVALVWNLVVVTIIPFLGMISPFRALVWTFLLDSGCLLCAALLLFWNAHQAWENFTSRMVSRGKLKQNLQTVRTIQRLLSSRKMLCDPSSCL